MLKQESLDSVSWFKRIAGRLVIILSMMVMVGIVVSLVKQLFIQGRLGRKLNQENKELILLQEKNRQLKLQLQEVENDQYFKTQAWKLFGMSEDGKPIVFDNKKSELKEEAVNLMLKEKIPNYQKWFNLFIK